MVLFSETGKDILKSDMILKGKCNDENVDDVPHEECDIPNIVGQTNSIVENGYNSEPCLFEERNTISKRAVIHQKIFKKYLKTPKRTC